MTSMTELREAGRELQSELRALVKAHQGLHEAHERGESDMIRAHLAAVNFRERAYQIARDNFQRLQTEHWVEKSHRPTTATIE